MGMCVCVCDFLFGSVTEWARRVSVAVSVAPLSFGRRRACCMPAWSDELLVRQLEHYVLILLLLLRAFPQSQRSELLCGAHLSVLEDEWEYVLDR